MKKENLLALLIVLVACFSAFGQRHYKGQKGIEIGGGVTKNGSFYQAGFVLFTGSKFYGNSTLFYETGKGPTSNYDYKSMGLMVTGNYTLFPPLRERYFFNAVGGIVACKDGLQKSILVMDASGNVHKDDLGLFKYGVVGGVEGECFISDKLVLTLGWKSFYLTPNSLWGDVRWQGTIKLRYNF